MLKLTAAIIVYLLFGAQLAITAQSTKVDSEGVACMGEERSKKQTVQAAMSEAKRKAAEYLLDV